MGFRKLFRAAGVIVFTVIAFLFSINFWIISSTMDRIHYKPESVQAGRVGLILGTSRRTVEGHNNLYFDQRIDAAAELFDKNYINQIVVSGDNRTQFYNEPRDMLNALSKKGIPERFVILDPEGTSTLASVVRSKFVYGHKKIVIITQDFHCYRALFIADHYGIDAVAYSADQRGRLSSVLATREVLARIKAVYDLYFGGDMIHEYIDHD